MTKVRPNLVKTATVSPGPRASFHLTAQSPLGQCFLPWQGIWGKVGASPSWYSQRGHVTELSDRAASARDLGASAIQPGSVLEMELHSVP